MGYLHFAPSLDETTNRFWGELPGLDTRIVEKAVDQRADQLPGDDRTLAVAQRRAVALVSICQDSLYETGTTTSTETTPVELTVTVDARTAADTNGETGVAVLAGRRLGVKALEAVLCDTTISIIGIAETGRPLDLGRKTRTIPPKLRRHILDRDGGCVVEGCSSQYRLQVHHTTPFSQGGRTDAGQLITLCWYHHQIAIHRLGLRIKRLGPSRIRLEQPGPARAPPATAQAV